MSDNFLNITGDFDGAEAAGMSWAGHNTFARLPILQETTGVDIAILGIAYDLGTTNRPGARFGPRAIREQSSLTAEFGRMWPWDYSVFDTHACRDAGDVAFPPGSTDVMLDAVGKRAQTLIQQGVRLVGLGGDHLVSYPLIKAHAAKYGPISLVHFDAHSDTWENPASAPMHHGMMFLQAAREGLIDPATSIQMGMRTPNVSHGFDVVYAPEFHTTTAQRTINRIRERVGDRPVYVTVDIDALDPAYAPATGTPVPGGLSTWQLREVLIGLIGLNIVGADCVEVAPHYEGPGQITAVAAATIAHDLMYLVAPKRVGS